MTFSEPKVCYYCGAKPSSKEHVPPKQMFRSFDARRITVPSCEIHNQQKGTTDDDIINGMLISITNVKNRFDIPQEVLTAIRVAKPDFGKVKNRVTSSKILDNKELGPKNQRINVPMAHIQASANVNGWIRQITAALFYSATHVFDNTINWDTTLVWGPDILPSEAPVPKGSQEIIDWFITAKFFRDGINGRDWKPSWIEKNANKYPETLYSFKVGFNKDGTIVFWHKFFSNYSWYISFKPAPEILEKLQKLY